MDEQSKDTIQHLGLWVLAIAFGILITYGFKEFIPMIEIAVLMATMIAIAWMLYFTLLIRLAKRIPDEVKK
jgi:Na+/H+-dicarboxylate symporter